MSRTILLADDSVTIQKVVELTFMDEDYEIVSVGDGDEALERLEEIGADLVIADVHMPGADGFELCRRAKESDPERPVLLLVGTFEPFDEPEAEDAGADAYLKKPFDSQELMRQVETLLGGADEDAVEQDEEPEPEVDEEGFDLGEEEGRWAEPSFDRWEETEETEAVTASAGAEEWDEEFETSPWTEAEDEDDETDEWERAEGLVSPETSGELQEPSEPLGAEPDLEEEPENGAMSEADVERIARRVVEMMGADVVREVAWEVVPDLAEIVIKDRIRELERELE